MKKKRTKTSKTSKPRIRTPAHIRTVVPDVMTPTVRKTTVRTTAAAAAMPAMPAVTKVPQPHGGALNSGGTPGNKGGMGRPPLRLLEALRKVREDPQNQEVLHRAAGDSKDPGFTTAWRLATDYDPDRPGQKHDLFFPDLTTEQMQDRIVGLLKVAAKRRREREGGVQEAG